MSYISYSGIAQDVGPARSGSRIDPLNPTPRNHLGIPELNSTSEKKKAKSTRKVRARP